MSWRPAKAITTLLNQLNAAYPNRPKDSDGVIGDASHASRTSDHNPNEAGVVCAVDITDPHGKPFDAWDIAEAVKDDPRVHYVIHDRKIYNRSVAPYWRQYNGASPHDEHVHISLWQRAALYDDPRPFNLKGEPVIPHESDVQFLFIELVRQDTLEALGHDQDAHKNGLAHAHPTTLTVPAMKNLTAAQKADLVGKAANVAAAYVKDHLKDYQ